MKFEGLSRDQTIRNQQGAEEKECPYQRGSAGRRRGKIKTFCFNDNQGIVIQNVDIAKDEISNE